MANYYCLMAGAPDLRLSDYTQKMTLAEMTEQCNDALTPEDHKLMFYFYLYWDCKNLVKLLENPDAEIVEQGNYCMEQYIDLITSARELTFNVHRFPRFLSEFARAYNDNKEKENYFAEDEIMLEYYKFASKCPNKMMRQWFSLNLNLNNILTALIARKNGWEVNDYVMGDDDVTEMLRTSTSKDFDLSYDYEFVKDLMPIVEETDPVQKEKRIDVLRWTWLDDKTFLDPFCIESVFAYMCKLQMLERWSTLDAEQGKAIFQQIIEDLRGSAKVPDEFKITSVYNK